MRRHSPSSIWRQRGVATLVVAIILLIAATFLTFFAAKVGMQEQRMSGNDYRHKEAFNLAEAGLDRAKAFLAANRQDFATWGWSACAGTETTPPCGDGTSNLFGAAWSWINVFSESGGAALAGLSWPASTADGPFILTQAAPGAISATTSFQPVVLASQAQSLDGTGRAMVRQSLTRYLIAQPGPVPPLMAPSVGLGGNFTVVGNPNHNIDILDITTANCDTLTGSGQLLSIWSRHAVTLSGSQQTCAPGAYRDASGNRCIGQGIVDPVTGSAPAWNQCQCSVDVALEPNYSSASAGTNDDVRQSDPKFPGDMFLYVFGKTKSAIKATAAGNGRVLPDCSTLNSSSSGLYWVTGACDIAQNAVIGSRTAPIILVYETSAEFRGGSDVWGMVVGADMERVLVNAPTGTAPYYVDGDFTSSNNTPATALLHGTFTLHGALIVEGTVTQQGGGGNYNILYDPCVFGAMGQDTSFDQYGPIAGSWNDAL
jgi:hypothetical protein